MLITSGLAHLPPIKVVTILSGVMHVNLWLFIVSAIVARGARFLFLAWLLQADMASRSAISSRSASACCDGGAAAVLILLYIVAHYLF